VITRPDAATLRWAQEAGWELYTPALVPPWIIESLADSLDVPETAIHMAMTEEHGYWEEVNT
jgi:hypothetical protein